jgi:Zinc knuckle
MAMRPTYFRDAEKIFQYCTNGLPESQRLGPAQDDKSPVSITTWISQLRVAMEDRGLDTVMRIYNASNEQELYMLDNKSWGCIASSDVTEWVNELTTGVYQTGSTTNKSPVCPHDIANLDRAGKFIMNSITLPLWSIIEKEVGCNPSGPAALHAIVQDAQVSTASMVQSLINQLKSLSLKHEPGQDVISFSNKVMEIARKLESTFIPVPNLEALILEPFTECDVEAFRTYATQLHLEADTKSCSPTHAIKSQATTQANPTSTWEASLNLLRNRFRMLKGPGKWPPLTSSKPTSDIQSLRNEVHTLRQAFSGRGGGRGGGRGRFNGRGSPGGRGGRGGRSNGRGRGGRGNGNSNGRVCFNCGDPNHFSRDCPSATTHPSLPSSVPASTPGGGTSPAISSNWKHQTPAAGQPEVKTVDGATWKFCRKCAPRMKWRQGPNAHTTSEHTGKGSVTFASRPVATAQTETQPSPSGGLRLNSSLFMASTPVVETVTEDDEDDPPVLPIDFPVIEMFPQASFPAEEPSIYLTPSSCEPVRLDADGDFTSEDFFDCNEPVDPKARARWA